MYIFDKIYFTLLTMSPSVARLIEQEEEWKAEVEADIAMKESRIKILQMEKEDRIAQV